MPFLTFLQAKMLVWAFSGETVRPILNLGVRFAQFASKATFDVRARPDLRTK